MVYSRSSLIRTPVATEIEKIKILRPLKVMFAMSLVRKLKLVVANNTRPIITYG